MKMLDVDDKENSVADMRHPSRIETSVALVETMVEHIFSDHKAISLYGVKRIDASYDNTLAKMRELEGVSVVAL